MNSLKLQRLHLDSLKGRQEPLGISSAEITSVGRSWLGVQLLRTKGEFQYSPAFGRMAYFSCKECCQRHHRDATELDMLDRISHLSGLLHVCTWTNTSSRLSLDLLRRLAAPSPLIPPRRSRVELRCGYPVHVRRVAFVSLDLSNINMARSLIEVTLKLQPQVRYRVPTYLLF